MIKTLDLDLGQIDASSMVDPPEVFATGWYVDQTTGQYCYYDALTGQWYVYSAGLLFPLAVSPLGLPSWQNSPSPKVDLIAGDTLRINMSFRYTGPRRDDYFVLYAAVIPNIQTTVIQEWEGYTKDKYISVPESITGITRTDSLDILIPAQVAPWKHDGEDGAVYFKIYRALSIWLSPGYLNAIHIIPAVGEFGELKITSVAKV